MKKLIYLLSIGAILSCTACNGGNTESLNNETQENRNVESEDLGCKSNKQNPKCLSDHSCCMQ